MSCMSVHVLPCTTVHEPVLGACPSALQTLSFGNCFGAPQCTYFTPQQGNQEPQYEIALPFMQNTSYSWACELPQPLQSPCMTRFMLNQQETQRSTMFPLLAGIRNHMQADAQSDCSAGKEAFAGKSASAIYTVSSGSKCSVADTSNLQSGRHMPS